MAANLPALQPDTVKSLTADDYRTAQALAKTAASLSGITAPSLEERSLAGSARTEATRIRKLLWQQADGDISKAFQLHRSLTAKRNRSCEPFDRMIAIFNQAIALYDRQEAARVAEERRKREAEQIAAAKAAQQAEADHLLAVAAATNDESLLEAAIETAAAPVTIAPISVETPAIHDGNSTITRKTIQITDLPAFLEYLATWPARETVVHVKTDMDEDGPALVILQRDLDNLANKGHSFPGTVTHDKSTVRSTGRK